MPRIADLVPRSLGGQIFLLSGALVTGAMLVAVVFTAWRAGQIARESVARALDGAFAAQAQITQDRIAQLRLTSRIVAGDPSFVAYVAESDGPSVRDLLFERQRELECDYAAVLDRSGRLIAHTGLTLATGVDVSGIEMISGALAGAERVGVWRDQGRLFLCVALPLVSGGTTLEGVLLIGHALDERLAAQIKRQSGAELAFVLRGPGEPVVASTLADTASLGKVVRSGGGLASLLAAPQRGRPVVLTLDRRRWAAAAVPVIGPDDPEGLTALTLAPLDLAVEPFRRIERAVLLIGLVALLAAFALSYALSRRVTRPIEQLADAADAARAGRFDQPLPTEALGEVGRLARTFDSLLTDLRDEREMETYLATLSRTLPDTAPLPPAQLAIAPPGTMIGGRFEILGWLGSGGMGVVYKARDHQLHDVVALKMLRPDAAAEGGPERIKSELRIARRITHRNVLRTHDFGEADGAPFISMEYVRGVTLRELLKQTTRLPLSVALRLARQLLAGLEVAHGLGVVHRDIKPENLILDPTGQLKIMDFGIARAAHDAGATETRAGTLGYLAPEQLAGHPSDARADLYACGVVLYEMLAGRRPYLAWDPNELAYRMMHEDPPPLAEHAPETPLLVTQLVMRCLARAPVERPESAAALLRTLETVRA
ncbi:MAG TPA: protein kinase [Candidatus Limnocylindria bacterium]|nr:protein kinase [Candidatus Limnocylindria bacterium]